MRPVLLIFLVSLGAFPVFTGAQPLARDSQAVYRIDPWLTAGLGGAGAAATLLGYRRNNDKPPLTASELDALRSGRVNGFDRMALRQNAAERGQARTISNIALYASGALPALLLLDDGARSDWLRIGLLYFETQAATGTLHSWAPFGPGVIDRIRPLAYYPEAPDFERRSGANRNSFYSGHTTLAAAGAFFTAKVLADYHPEWGGRRWWLYGAALLPPVTVGYFRIRALRHFPTDVIAGTLAGAATGILIPELHRIKKGRYALSFRYDTEMKGLHARVGL